MGDRNQKFGRQGEEDAAERALQLEYSVLARNYRTPYGEIDLILKNPEGEIVFAEVKSRVSSYFGFPESAVITPLKGLYILLLYSSIGCPER